MCWVQWMALEGTTYQHLLVVGLLPVPCFYQIENFSPAHVEGHRLASAHATTVTVIPIEKVDCPNIINDLSLHIIHLDFVTNATLTKHLICKQYSSADDSMVLLLDTCSYSPLLIFKRNNDILVCYLYQNIFSVQMDAQIQCIHFKCHTCRTTNLGMKVCKTDIHV